jgi:hypothetical protein
MRRIGSNNVAIISAIGPVSTIIQAHFILREKIFPAQIAGTLLVIIGVVNAFQSFTNLAFLPYVYKSVFACLWCKCNIGRISFKGLILMYRYRIKKKLRCHYITTNHMRDFKSGCDKSQTLLFI